MDRRLMHRWRLCWKRENATVGWYETSNSNAGNTI